VKLPYLEVVKIERVVPAREDDEDVMLSIWFLPQAGDIPPGSAFPVDALASEVRAAGIMVGDCLDVVPRRPLEGMHSSLALMLSEVTEALETLAPSSGADPGYLDEDDIMDLVLNMHSFLVQLGVGR
jgi:hypothetical protein